jgi:hypothetical protein
MARGRKVPKAVLPEGGSLGEEAGAADPDQLITSETLVPVDDELPEGPPAPPAPAPVAQRPRYKWRGGDPRCCTNIKSIRPADEPDVGLAGGRAQTVPRHP